MAIVRLTSLGDVVHTLPLAHAIRRSSPSACIVWVVEEHEQALVRDNPSVDEVVVTHVRRWRRDMLTPGGLARVAREIRAIRDRLVALELDIAIDVQGLAKSSLFTMLAGARDRIGFSWRAAREPLSTLFTTRWVTPASSAVHIVDKNLALLGPLGIHVAPGNAGFTLPELPEADRRIERLLHGNGVGPEDRVIVVMPSTRRPSKLWPVDHTTLLSRRLAAVRNTRLVLVGSPAEEPLMRQIAGALDGHRPIAFTSPIDDLVALFRRAHLAVGGDTGPVHLAAALQVPTLGLYGPTSGARNAPYGARNRRIQSPTGRMRDIPVDEVFNAAVALLGEGRTQVNHTC